MFMGVWMFVVLAKLWRLDLGFRACLFNSFRRDYIFSFSLNSLSFLVRSVLFVIDSIS